MFGLSLALRASVVAARGRYRPCPCDRIANNVLPDMRSFPGWEVVLPSLSESAAKTRRRTSDVTTTALCPDRARRRLRRFAINSAVGRADRRKGQRRRTRSAISKQVRPLLQANCYGCHQPAKAKGEYQMTSWQGLLRGGESGSPAVVPGKPEESHLLELITAARRQGRDAARPLAAGRRRY